RNAAPKTAPSAVPAGENRESLMNKAKRLETSDAPARPAIRTPQREETPRRKPRLPLFRPVKTGKV
ncbi:hypothetical protein V5H42_25730, partial [Salmonella enterica]